MLSNPTHETFVQEWFLTGSKSDAYRKAYPKQASRWKDATLHNKAYILSKRGEILERFGELQREAEKAHGVTVATLLKELEEARAAGLNVNQVGASVSATMGKAKLLGLDQPKLEPEQDNDTIGSITVEVIGANPKE